MTKNLKYLIGFLIMITLLIQSCTVKNIPNEVVEIEFNDGRFFYITSKWAEKVLINPLSMQYIVVKFFNRTIGEISVITHNHVGQDALIDFSFGDMFFLDNLRKLGFKGRFRLWTRGQFKEW